MKDGKPGLFDLKTLARIGEEGGPGGMTVKLNPTHERLIEEGYLERVPGWGPFDRVALTGAGQDVVAAFTERQRTVDAIAARYRETVHHPMTGSEIDGFATFFKNDEDAWILFSGLVTGRGANR